MGRGVGFEVGLGLGTAVSVRFGVGVGEADAATVLKKKLNAMYAIIGRILQWIAWAARLFVICVLSTW